MATRARVHQLPRCAGGGGCGGSESGPAAAEEGEGAERRAEIPARLEPSPPRLPGEVPGPSLEVATRDAEERVRFLEEAAQKNGRGALGFEAVADALNQRKLDRLRRHRDLRRGL